MRDYSLALDGTTNECAEALIAKARALREVLAQRSTVAEQERDVSVETMDDLFSSGLMNIIQPKKYGGLEQRFSVFSRVIEELAHGCSSTAWVYGVLNEMSWILACFSDQAQREVWGDDPRTLGAGSVAPRATAVAVPGGYRLTGKWGYCSGSAFAKWFVVGAFVEEGASKSIRYFLVPKADIKIIDDWFTLGMRATGSRTISLDDVFIPNHRSLRVEDMQTGTTPGAMDNPDYALARAPRFLFAIYCQPPVMIALGRQAHDLVTAALSGRTSMGHLQPAKSEFVQMQIAEADAEVDCAHLLLNTCRKTSERIFDQQLECTSMDIARLRRDIVHAAQLTLQASRRLKEVAGTIPIYDDSPLQRMIRDIETCAAHVVASRHSSYANYGRIRLGVEQPVPLFPRAAS